MNTNQRHPYSVRKITSGRVAGEKFIVVMNPGGRRVSVEAHHGRRGAQMAADDLNITAMAGLAADDPRPFEVRRAEAEAAYRAEVGER